MDRVNNYSCAQQSLALGFVGLYETDYSLWEGNDGDYLAARR